MLGCYLTEQLFLENDGVFHLMDLLQVTNRHKLSLKPLPSFYWLPKRPTNQRVTCANCFMDPFFFLLTSQKLSLNLGFTIFLLASEKSQRIKEPHMQIALQA